MPIKVQSKKQKEQKGFYKIMIVTIAILAIAFVLNIAPNYIKSKIANKVNLIVNNNQITASLKNDVLIKDGTVFISQEDIKTFFDNDIYFDDDYEQIVTTSDTKVAVLPVNSKNIIINGANVNIYDTCIRENGKYYIPFSQISKMVYNIETRYVEKTNTVIAISLDRELTYANSTKNNSVKYKPTVFSKTVDKIGKGENVIIVLDSKANSQNSGRDQEISSEDKWAKVTTENGKIGYVKANTLANTRKIREDFFMDKQIQGKVSLVWDYFSEYASAPQRTGKIEGINVVSPSFVTLKKQGRGDIDINIETAGQNYIKWAHNNGYKVWTMVSNNSLKDTTSEILNDYKLREQLIENLLNLVEKYDIDGINLDFENMYEADKDCYTKLIIELAPRLREMGKVISVDVTAPDGSPEWSLCFDRNKIAKAADYIVFMAYDQYGASSTKAGTTAGYDWVLTGLKKFIDENRESVDRDKLILGIPFYTRLWKVNGDNVDSSTISMKNTYSNLPSGVTPVWNSDLHQYYAEYEQRGTTYKIWIEDLNSITDKLKLIKEYNLSGVAFWAKGMEDEKVWDVVKETILNDNK